MGKVTGGRSKAQAGPSEQTRPQPRRALGGRWSRRPRKAQALCAKGRQGGGRQVGSRVGEGGRRATGGGQKPSSAAAVGERRACARRDRGPDWEVSWA